MKAKEIERARFHYLVQPFYFPNRRGVKAFLLGQLKKAGKEIRTISYIFCTDEYLLKLNQDFLSHNTYTDIITFELSEKGESLVADIYISVERVRENAKQFSTSFLEELHRVIFHGALHLVGFKDKTEKESRHMRHKEDEWLSLYRVSRENKDFKD